jgi:GntR family transcriptional regulator / MocR family aminotransferase
VQSLDRSGRVVYVGSFSKTLLPVLRLGFCVSPAPLHAALRKAKHLADWHTAVPMQAALARLIDDGLLARHVRRMRRIYQDRRDRIGNVLARDFAGLRAPMSSVAGLHLAVRMPDRDDRAVVARAARAGVGVVPLSSFALRAPGPPGLVLGYGLIPADRIEAGLRILHRIVTET